MKEENRSSALREQRQCSTSLLRRKDRPEPRARELHIHLGQVHSGWSQAHCHLWGPWGFQYPKLLISPALSVSCTNPDGAHLRDGEQQCVDETFQLNSGCISVVWTRGFLNDGTWGVKESEEWGLMLSESSCSAPGRMELPSKMTRNCVSQQTWRSAS